MGIKSSFFAKARGAASRSGVHSTGNSAIRQTGGAMRPDNGNEAVFLDSDDGLLLRALEPRILLDAAGVETGIDLAEKMAMEDAAQRFPDSPAVGNGAAPDSRADADAPEDLAAAGDDANAPVEIVFVDGAIKDLDTIMAGIGSGYEAVFLAGDLDGVSQIADYLADRNDIDAIHIFAHGRAGTLDLGNAKLTSASINGRHAEEMAVIRTALSQDADILIYGCNFAAGSRGQTAVTTLMEASGADVTASSDATGAAVLGGDWDLEITAGDIEAASIVATDWDGLLATGGGADDNGGGSGIAVTGNITTNIDVLANDTVTGAATLTQIIDPSDPGNPLTLAVGVPVQLTTNTTIELLADGTLDVTTSPLGQGTETFDYVFIDGASGGQATVTLDRTQGSLIIVPSSVSGTEDNNVPLGITIDPALTSGGSQLDLIVTDIGFRDASTGATPTDFTIPPRTTAIQITAYGAHDNAGSNSLQENRQTFTVTVDLGAGTYSGQLLYVISNTTSVNDLYAFSDLALGTGSFSATNLTGDISNSRNELTVSVSGNTLSLVESQTVLDQAYLVEFLTADGTSSNYLGSSGVILDAGATAAETTATIATDANANFLVVNIQDGRGTNNTEQEDNGGGRIIVDLDTGLASGVLYGSVGSGGNSNTAYSFTGYDITSGAFIVDPATRAATAAGGATVIGDTAATALDRLPNYIISMSGNDLVLERSSDFAGLFEELISVQSYERFDVGSSAQALGSDAVFADYRDNGSLATWDLDISGGAETGIINLASSQEAPGPNSRHDHGATARIFVDLENNSTSGSFFLIRANNPDLIVWTDVPFGTRLADAIGMQASANFADLTQTTIDIVGALQFDLITNPDGSQTLRASAQSDGNADSNQTWATLMQAQWSGREPVTISGYPNGGSFSAGALNPDTNQWEVDATDITGLEFIPPEHFSGQTTTMIVDYNGDQQSITLDIARVADAPTLVTTSQSGDEDTVIDISDAFTASLVDTDGSETITLIELSNIQIGHTVSDGTNSFTATAGSQTVDISSWNRTTLTYQGALNVNGTFTITVRAQTTDQDDIAPDTGLDTAETTTTFDVVIDQVNDAPTVDLNDDGTTSDRTFAATYTENAGAMSVTATNASITDPDDVSLMAFDIDLGGFNDSGAEEIAIGSATLTYGTALTIQVTAGATTFEVVYDGANAIDITRDGGGKLSMADTETLMRTVTYRHTGDNPTPGDRTLSFTASDGSMTSNAAISTITVNAVNDAPSGANNTIAVNEDTAHTFAVTDFGFSDPAEGDAPLSVFITTLPNAAEGALTLSGAPVTAGQEIVVGDISNLVFTPVANLSGTGLGSFTFQVRDDGGTANGGVDTDQSPNTIRFDIANINDAPVAVDDGPVSVTEDTPASGNVLANDSDVDNTPAELGVTQFTVDTVAGTFNAGDTATITGVGTLTIAANGDFTFTPAAGYNGPVPSATYTVFDGALTGTATLSFSDVGAVNDDPLAQDDVLTTPEDTTLNANLLADNGNGTDSDPDSGDTLTIASATIDTNGDGGQDALTLGMATAITDNAANPVGTITVEASGALTFVPAANYNGPVPALTYTLSDGNGGTDTATATISVTPINDAPQLNLDPDNNSGTPGDPADDGADDGGFEVTFNENDSPVAIVDTDLMVADPDDDILEIVVTLTDGKAGDTINFPNTLPGNVSATSMPAPILAADGVLTLTLTGDASTTLADWTAILQALSFTPSASSPNNPDPADRHFTIQASDSAMAVSTARNTVVHVVPLNDVPTLDLDADNSSGINAGNYQTTYVEGAAAEAISDGALITDLDDTQLEGLTVVLTNGEAGDALSVGTLPAGITLSGGAPAELTAAGTITITLTGSASAVDYQSAIAAIGFANASDDPATGVREIAVTATDGEASTPARNAFITVQAVNDPPGIVDPANPGTPPADPNDVIPDQSGVDSAALTALDASVYFHDPDSATLTYSLGAAAPAWLSINATSGIITGTPPANASQNSNIASAGSYDVVVIAEDPDGATGQTTVTYTIANPAPTTTADAFAIAEGAGSATGNVITADNGNGVDSDPDGDVLSVAAVNGVSGDVGSAVTGELGGLFTVNANGAFTFVENGDFDDLAGGETRTTRVSYTLSDGEGGQSVATVSVTITGTNDAPVVVSGSELADATGTDAQTFTPIDVKPAFNDPDGTDTLTYTATGLPDGLSLNPTTGIISGTMDSSTSQNGNTGTATDGVYTVAVTASDGNGGTVSDTFTITVGNPPPVARDDAFSTDQDTAITGENALANNGNGADSDPDGDAPLTVIKLDGDGAKVGQQIAGTGGGLFTIAGDGSLSFDPNGDFDDLGSGESAAATTTYQLSDGEGGFNIATVTVTVSGLNDGPIPVDPANPGTPPADPNNYIPAQSAADGETVAAFDVTAYVFDPDATDTLTFFIDPAELPAGLSFDGSIISGTLAASASVGGDDPSGNPGRYLIPLTVTDEDGATFATTITYNITNPAPDARDDNAATNEDAAINGSVFADNGNGADSDPDGDTFTVTLVGGDAANVGMAVAGSNGGTFTIGATGSYTFEPGSDFRDLSDGETRQTLITYTIDDGNGGADQAAFTVTVNGANNAPIIIDPTQPIIDPNDPPVPADPNNFLTDQTGSDSTPLTPFDVSPYFHDVEGNAMTFSLEQGAPGWLSIDSVSGILTGTPPSDGSTGGSGGDGIHAITLRATDSSGDGVSTTIDYTISNPPPVSTGLADQSEIAGASFVMETADSFSDPDGDKLSFSASGLPAGLSIDPATGRITGTIDGAAASGGPNGNGVYSVSVTADDGQGGTATASLVFTVGDITSPGIVPPVDPLPPVSGAGDPIILPEPASVVGDVVNGISQLGGNTGIFNPDHPITQVLYQISPLAVSSSLDSDGLPLTQTIEWIGNTRALLDRSGEAAWLKGANLRDTVAEYYLGGDALPGGGSSDFVVRTLSWGPVLFVEIASANRGFEWELESVDGKAPGREVQAYGANLFAIPRASGSEASIVMRGADEAGNETLLEIGVLPASGQLIDVRAIDGQNASLGLSDQIRKLVDAKRAAIRSPFASLG